MAGCDAMARAADHVNEWRCFRCQVPTGYSRGTQGRGTYRVRNGYSQGTKGGCSGGTKEGTQVGLTGYARGTHRVLRMLWGY